MSSDPIRVLLQAAADDNITQLRQKLSTTTSSTQRVSLLLACRRGSTNYVKEIIRLKPDLAYIRDDRGYTVLHTLVGDKSPVVIVEALIKSHPDHGRLLCIQTDHECTTPIHMAAKQGSVDLLKALIGACGSGSLRRVTSLHQTALHLALEHGQTVCFDIMVEELLKHEDDQQLKSTLPVLNLKDHQGNTVLHIAIAKKQTMISGFLLADNPKRRPLVEANIKNNLGFTALQLHDYNSSERDERRVRQLLISAGLPKDNDQVVVASLMAISHSNSENIKMTSLTAKSLVMGAMSLIATMIFGSLAFYGDIYKVTHPVPPHATLLAIYPLGFYYLTVATATFLVCMFTTLALLWSVHCTWSMHFRAIGLFICTASLFLFGLTVKELVPRFSVTTFGAHRISSLCLLGFYVVALPLLFFFTFLLITKLISFIVSRVSID